MGIDDDDDDGDEVVEGKERKMRICWVLEEQEEQEKEKKKKKEQVEVSLLLLGDERPINKIPAKRREAVRYLWPALGNGGKGVEGLLVAKPVLYPRQTKG